MPAALGWVNRKGLPGLAGFGDKAAIALRQGLLHHPLWNVALDRVGRRAHSLKRDIGSSARNRRDDSPRSMTSPRTTLTRGQCAPLLHRSSPAPHSTLPQRRHPCVSSARFAARADYFANPAVNRTRDAARSLRFAAVAAGRLARHVGRQHTEYRAEIERRVRSCRR
jgi:hypothetical protein